MGTTRGKFPWVEAWFRVVGSIGHFLGCLFLLFEYLCPTRSVISHHSFLAEEAIFSVTVGDTDCLCVDGAACLIVLRRCLTARPTGPLGHGYYAG